MIFPDELYIPPLLRTDPMNLEDWKPARVFISRLPCVELDTGVVRIESPEDLLKCFTTKHTLTICKPGVFDSLMRWFSRVEIFRMDLGCRGWIGDWQFRYRGNSIKINKGREHRYIWNLWMFFTLEEEPTNLDTVESLIDLLLHHFQVGEIEPSDLASPASVSRRLMSRFAPAEFTKRVDEEALMAFGRCSHGGRQESVGIGSKKVWNYDMRRAHLGILSELVSTRGCQLRRNFPYNPEASYGAYLIKANIPSMPLCPLPVERVGTFSGEVVYPHGMVSGWYAKPYLELLTALGIKFSVIESFQLIPFKEPTKPFSGLAKFVDKFIDSSPWFINSKGLYFGIAGSTVSWRAVVDETSGEFVNRTFSVFNPLIYSHVLAVQSVRIFMEALGGKPVALRSDAVTMEEKLPQTSLKFEDEGITTFLTPLFKVFPSGRGEFWRDLMVQFKDSPTLEYAYTEYPTVQKFLTRGKPLGKLSTTIIRIKPNHGKRVGLKPKRIGDLLEAWIPSKSPDIHSLH